MNMESATFKRGGILPKLLDQPASVAQAFGLGLAVLTYQLRPSRVQTRTRMSATNPSGYRSRRYGRLRSTPQSCRTRTDLTHKSLPCTQDGFVLANTDRKPTF